MNKIDMTTDDAHKLCKGTNLWVEGDRKEGIWVWRVWHIGETREYPDSAIVLTTESDVMLVGFIIGWKNCLHRVNGLEV